MSSDSLQCYYKPVRLGSPSESIQKNLEARVHLMVGDLGKMQGNERVVMIP